MNNLQIAQILNEIADLLEMKGVEFKPRAYRKAARSVKTLSRDIEDVYNAHELKELPGVGESIAEKISELIETGHLEYYENLKEEYPIDYEKLLAVEGIGPKTVKKLYKELHIKTLDDLEKAAKNHKIRELEGFGKKSEQEILENISFARSGTERKLLGYILPVAQSVAETILSLDAVKRLETAGSIRRRKPTIGDIDILVITDTPEKVMDFFTNMDNVKKIIVTGPSKSSVRLEEGMDCDVRVIEKKSFGSALLYFTGSKAHNVELRKIAMDKNMKLNEYGLFKDNNQIAGKNEQEVFKKLDMQYIPPEMRENRGEIESAIDKNIPDIIEYTDIRGDLQMHTKWSDGDFTIKEMAQQAKELGHEYIAITDHTGTLKIAGGLEPEDMRDQIEEISTVNEELDGITILTGAEVNIDSEGNLDMTNDVLKDLDVVVASIHGGFRQSEEQLTDRILSAMKNKHVNIIAHPTGRKIHEREAYNLDLDTLFEKSKKTNTYFEINSYPNRLDLNSVNVKRAIQKGCKLVINTDAHNVEHLRYIKLGIATARRGWATKADIINTLPFKDIKEVL